VQRRVIVGLALIALIAASTTSEAQRRGGGLYGVRMATPASFDSSFQFCRAFFGGGGRRGSSWGVDYPRADVNLSIRLSELTKARVSFDDSREPNHLVVQFTDDELFQCPFVMMTEVGSVYFEDDEVERLREYLKKGGFLWADDFWGSQAWSWWYSQISRVLPSGEFRLIDLPLDHPLFRTHFVVRKIPQIPSINYWMGSGGDTSEAGYDSAVPHARAIVDEHDRLLVLMTHNTDVGDSWEREGDDPNYFYQFAVDGYALGINIVLYAMSH
jgi:hypothetical protein